MLGELLLVGVAGEADPGDAGAVGGPGGVVVLVGAGLEVGEGFGGEVVDGDEAVVAAMADEAEPFAVGREGEVAEVPAGVEELLGLGGGFEGDGPDLVVEEVEEGVAGVGEDWGAAGGEGAWVCSGGEIGDPDLLFDAAGEECGVGGGLGWVFKVAAAGEGELVAVGGPADVADVDAVVGGEAGELAGGGFAGFGLGEPEVATAFRVGEPGGAVGSWSGGEAGAERGAEGLGEGEAGLGGGLGAGGKGGEEGDEGK